jgi:hypothetical protein
LQNSGTAEEVEYSIGGFVTEKKKKCPVLWHLLNTVTPCNGPEAAQGRCSTTMRNITEMDRLHENLELQCSPLRTPEEYLVSYFHVRSRNENFQKFVFPSGVRYKTLQNCPYFSTISSVFVYPREQLEKRQTVFFMKFRERERGGERERECVCVCGYSAKICLQIPPLA